MKLLNVLLIAVALVAGPAAVPAQTAADNSARLHQAFLDPPRDFSPMPFWFWNGKMEGPIVQQEIRDMVDQHVYGAFLHGRDGLETPYLSKEWFDAIGAGLEQSKKSGFEFNFVDEYDWPSGEARNIWMAGNHQSEVLARQPGFRMQTLAWEAKQVDGPEAIDLPVDPGTQAVVAARWLGENQIDSQSLTLISSDGTDGHVHWQAPEGHWVVVSFTLRPAMGFDGGFVDLMNPEATSLFFDLVYGEYHRRFASYFGNIIHYSFSDHEGDYGYRIAWTPQLFASFHARTGYDLRRMLPLLIYDGGDQTVKLRDDYLATITALYGGSFWRGITDKAAGLGIGRTGHAWEESLQWAAALEGSLFTVERGLNPVGVDSLEDFGRQPLNFKVAQSVADFEGRRFACENQGVQGTNSYLDLEGIRKATNAIGAWGVNLFVPHAFDYDAGRANYPPDWLHQPYWRYFHTYADYTRRISYMNADSHHVTSVLLYYPITSVWGETQPLFSGSTNYQEIGRPSAWRNQTILLNDYYSRIIQALADDQRDFNIADDQYLEQARIEGNELVIGPQRFRAIVLPPITTLSRATLRKLEEFHRAGGLIFGIRLLPTASPEAGGHDPEVRSGIAAIFDSSDGSSAQSNDGPKRSFFIDDSVDALIASLDANLPNDVQVVSGPASHLYFEHRRKMDTDYYWVVNDTPRARVNQVHFSVRGVAEKWDALTGARDPLFSAESATGTDVRLALGPWDAYYVVFHPLDPPAPQVTLERTNAEEVYGLSQTNGGLALHLAGPAGAAATFAELRSEGQIYRGEVPGSSVQPITLDGDWQFRPQPDRISVPYARISDAPVADGTARGWAAAGFDDTGWPEMWLSEEQTTVRHWQLIGPFPNPDNNGFAKAYPPEQSFDPQGVYDGADARVRWEDYNSNEPYLALNDWSIWMKTHGGRDSDSGYIVNFNPELLTDGREWIVSYAHTFLYSPQDQHAQLVIAADNWAAVWLNHKQVFSQLRTPFWYELNDHWADHVAVDLHKGWNEVLVKVGKGRGTASGFYGFTFRVADDSGATLTDVVANTSPDAAAPLAATSEAMRWYRIQVPPGCVAVMPPPIHRPYRMLLNGRELHPEGDTPIDLRGNLSRGSNVLVIVAPKDDPLVTPVQFVTGETPFELQPWTRTGLANYSGTAVYTKSFTLPAGFRGRPVMLDLGRVSSVAEVFLNGQRAGTLVWQPYRLDISKLVRPGKNELRIVVTDTEANRRAVGTSRSILAAIDICGLEGPVRLLPWVDQVVRLQTENKGVPESKPANGTFTHN